jgi:trigger factor
MSETTVAEIEITVARQDAASRTFAVTVPAERVREVEAETIEWYGKRAKVPGFRKGHVPAPVVRRRFGDAIRQSVIEDLLRKSWEQARTREALKPIGEPHIHNLSFEDGAPLTFELQVDVRPEVPLDRPGGFRLTRRIPAVADETVDAQLLALREQKAPWMPAEGKAKPGDLVQATIANLNDAEAPVPEPVRFVLGQGRALPDLEAHLMELDIEGAWEGTLRFPDDHPDASKRGQTRRVRVTLHEVKRQALPELTDDFARELGDFDSVAALRAAVRSDLQADARREADTQVRAELIDQIAAANNVAVPPSLTDRALRAYMAAYEVPEDQRDRFASEFRPVAETGVRRELIVDAAAERYSLAATAGEVDARVAEIAARRAEPPHAVKAALEKAGRLRELERSLTEEKVFAHLLGLSTVEDAPIAR